MKKLTVNLSDKKRGACFRTIVSFALPKGKVWSAEGKVKGNTIYVGWDAKLGRVLSLIPFSGDIFLAGSYAVYKAVQAGKFMNRKLY